MEKTKISSLQLGALTALVTCGGSLITIAAGVSGKAKQDAWISIIVSTIIGLLFFWIWSYLGSLYPDKTFVEMIQIVLGKWIGGFIAVNFVFLCFLSVPQLSWYMSNFMTTQSLYNTLPYSIDLVYILVCTIALLYGLETFARASIIFLCISSFLFILAMLLSLPNAKIDNLFPVLENGITPILKGTLPLLSFLTWPSILFMMIFPKNVNNIKASKKAMFMGYLWGSFLVFISILMSTMVLGSSFSAKSQFPIFQLSKEINIGSIFNRLEAVTAGAWIITLFAKIIMYFYAGVIGLSQLLGLKDYKKIVLPIGLITLVLAEVVYPNTAYSSKWDGSTWVFWIATFSVILPIVLLMGSFLKKI